MSYDYYLLIEFRMKHFDIRDLREFHIINSSRYSPVCFIEQNSLEWNQGFALMDG